MFVAATKTAVIEYELTLSDQSDSRIRHAAVFNEVLFGNWETIERVLGPCANFHHDFAETLRSRLWVYTVFSEGKPDLCEKADGQRSENTLRRDPSLYES